MAAFQTLLAKSFGVAVQSIHSRNGQPSSAELRAAAVTLGLPVIADPAALKDERYLHMSENGVCRYADKIGLQ